MRLTTDHDALFKELLTAYFAEFVALFFPKLARYLDHKSIAFLDKEIIDAGERREADLVAKAKFRGREAYFLIHIENQSRADTQFARRMFRYFSRLHEKHGVPVYPIVIFSYDKPQRAEPHQYRVTFPDLKVLEFSFRVVQLNRLNWRSFLRRRNPVASALMARMAIAPEDRARVKVECLRLLATFRLELRRARLISRFVDAYLNLNTEEYREFQREWSKMDPVGAMKEKLMAYVTSWERTGMRVGRKQGVQSMARRLVRAKFGTVGRHLMSRIDALPTGRKQRLAEVIFTLNTLADLEAWLSRK